MGNSKNPRSIRSGPKDAGGSMAVKRMPHMEPGETASGQFVEFQAKVLRSLPRSLTAEDYQTWIRDPDLPKKFERFFKVFDFAYIDFGHKRISEDGFEIEVGNSISAREYIKRGKYDKVSDQIYEFSNLSRFSLNYRLRVELKSFASDNTPEELRNTVKNINYRFLSDFEMLAFASGTVSCQFDYPIMTIGDSGAVVLSFLNDGRQLRIYSLSDFNYFYDFRKRESVKFNYSECFKPLSEENIFKLSSHYRFAVTKIN
jgi:hypothetical protein